MQVNLEKLAINIDQQSTLARLLAQENIHVIHGNYRTAWFDPSKRVLALPIWKNRGKAVYDLLTGHEVGHALYTPAAGWHDAVDDIKGAPKAYLNVLEDVRIERKVQDKYPGLRSQFKKAYKQLGEEDFFGIEKLQGNYSDMLLIDRINLKSKLAEFVEVHFDAGQETDFFRRAYLTETFDDVVALAIEIYEYQKQLYKNYPQLPINELPQLPQSDETSYDNSGDYHKPEELKETPPENTEQKPSDEKPKGEEVKEEEEEPQKIKGRKKPEHEEQKEMDASQAIEGPSEEPKPEVDDSLEALESMTDAAFRAREAELTAGDDLKGTMVYSLGKVDDKEIIIDYKDYYSTWKNHTLNLNEWNRDNVNSRLEELKPKFMKFKTETEQAAAYMAKEFELRKAAYQYSRATVHKTGLINTNKLHAYKYSEDIFLKSTRLANYKNHGMLMYIDFSGSMQDNIGPTIRQILNLTTFCKMVNIPYEVYAFTTRVKCEEDDSNADWKGYFDCEVVPQKFNLLNLMSSRMTRTEYQEGMHRLWALSMAWDGALTSAFINPWNHLHSTPLNSCIAFANEQIKAFKLKHGVERMTAMFLTDGASDSFQVRMTDEGEEHRPQIAGSWRSQKTLMRFAGHTMDVGSMHGSKVTEEMLRVLKKNTGANILGFFISQYRNEAVGIVCDAKRNYSARDKYIEQMNKNRAIIEDNIFGYDRYFGLCNKYIDIVEDEFGDMVEDGASKGKIKTAFAKLTKAKRVNRILLNAFVDSIA